VSGKAADQGRGSLLPTGAADIHATSALRCRFHPSTAQPIAAAVSREPTIYDVKTRPYHAANFGRTSVNRSISYARKFGRVFRNSISVCKRLF